MKPAPRSTASVVCNRSGPRDDSGAPSTCIVAECVNVPVISMKTRSTRASTATPTPRTTPKTYGSNDGGPASGGIQATLATGSRYAVTLRTLTPANVVGDRHFLLMVTVTGAGGGVGKLATPEPLVVFVCTVPSLPSTTTVASGTRSPLGYES